MCVRGRIPLGALLELLLLLLLSRQTHTGGRRLGARNLKTGEWTEISGKGPYPVLPNLGMTPATLIAHYLTWRLHLPYLACSSDPTALFLKVRRSPGRCAAAHAAKTAATRLRGLRRKRSEVALRPPAPDSCGCGPCISTASAQRAYLYSRRRSRPCRP